MKYLTQLKRWLLPILGGCVLATADVRAALVPVTEDIASGTTVTWTADNEYRLDSVIYVQTNATLIIEPGTVIKGATNVTIGRPGIPEQVSALWVTRGGKLIAEGTKEDPIIFTAEGDNLEGNIPPTQTSLWGGVVLLGKGVLNTAKHTVGNASTPKFDVYEGVRDNQDTGLPYPEHMFGGSDDADSSGSLRYVSIRHAGRIFAQAAELNCLTMGGVGSGTGLQYIEVYAGSDDGFEWWGGTASSKHLVSAFIEDDDFDTDQGYRGTNQFWFGIKAPWAQATSDSRGIESDGDLNQSAQNEPPVNRWQASNVTLIGRGKGVTAADRGRAWNTRDEDAANVFNSVFAEWDQGLLLDSDGLLHYTNSPALGSIRNNVWDVTTNANSNGQFIFTTAEFNNIVGNAMLGGISYDPNGTLDPRPMAGSPLIGTAMAGGPMTVSYRGAFSGPADNWADGWTALSQYGYLKSAAPPTGKPIIPVTEDIASGMTVTWTADNEYRLDSVIYVQTNATLIIEPGTVIKGATNVTIGRPGIPEQVSALWVTRGGKLIAEGTKEDPIIFTAEGDNLEGNIPPTQTSLWGGVVLLGKGVLNTAKHTVGNASTPKFDVYEGVRDNQDTGLPYPEHMFGGSDDADSSGSLRYVSIRHAGRIFAQAAELNCLTMGGVGSGTGLQYIEVYAGSDDGFEWWGGTASSKHLVSAFIEDDDFDTDQGYRGTNQFWFGIKAPWAQATSDSRGIESDGDLNQSAQNEPPVNRWQASNVTLIGRGKGVTAADRGRAWNTRDEDAANVFNSVFAEWDQGLLLDSDGLLHYTNSPALGSIRNNVWDVTTNANSNGQFIFTTAEFNNIVGNAMLGGISYDPNGTLDPRPMAGSPLIGTAMAGGPMTVSYRGAFSGPSDDWADGWTALSQYGYLKPAAAGEIEGPLIVATRSGANLVLTFNTQNALLYRLESSLDLVTWSQVGGAGGTRVGTGGEASFSIVSSAGIRFYRLRVENQ